MNKNLIGRLVALGLVVSSIVGFGTVKYDETTGGALSSKINELKQLATDWKNNATAKDKLISEKEQALQELQGRYDSILGLLGLEAGASEKDIQNAISSKQDIGDIATALGLEAGASKKDILDKITSINEEIAQLEGAINDLESVVGQLTAEIERLQGEVNKANNTEQVMLEELMVTIEDIGTPVEGEEGEEEGPTVEEEGPTVEEEGPTVEELQAELDSIWSQFSSLVANDSSKFTNGRVVRIQEGAFTLDNSNGYKVLVENGSTIEVETTEHIYNLLSQYKEKLELYNSLLAQQ